MLVILLLSIPFSVAVQNEESTPYAVLRAAPLDLPYRNDRATQCWLRIEDIELTETVTVSCQIAQEFLLIFIHEYNTRKMLEDNVDVSLWNEEPRPLGDIPVPKEDTEISEKENLTVFVDWKQTTVKDPTTQRRLYVTKKAACRLIMYSRDGVTNYQVDCSKVLYFVNVRMNSCALFNGDVKMFVLAVCIVLFNSL